MANWTESASCTDLKWWWVQRFKMYKIQKESKINYKISWKVFFPQLVLIRKKVENSRCVIADERKNVGWWWWRRKRWARSERSEELKGSRSKKSLVTLEVRKRNFCFKASLIDESTLSSGQIQGLVTSSTVHLPSSFHPTIHLNLLSQSEVQEKEQG